MTFFFFNLKKKKRGLLLGFKFRIYYNRFLVWVEFKFVEIETIKYCLN